MTHSISRFVQSHLRSSIQSITIFYYRFFRGFRNRLSKFPAIYGWFARKPKSKLGSWFKSLFFSGDLKGMVALDLAWWPYRAMQILESSETKKRVFEWGSGASTLWLTRRFEYVVSVEHDETWYQELNSFLRSEHCQNVELMHIPGEKKPIIEVPSSKPGFEDLDFSKYASAIEGKGVFDLIVIDGRARAECLIRAKEHLSENGLIFFDNSGRKRYREALRVVASHLSVEHVRGLTPSSPLPTRSSFFAWKVKRD